MPAIGEGPVICEHKSCVDQEHHNKENTHVFHRSSQKRQDKLEALKESKMLQKGYPGNYCHKRFSICPISWICFVSFLKHNEGKKTNQSRNLNAIPEINKL
jgi:hypothetical protein